MWILWVGLGLTGLFLVVLMLSLGRAAALRDQGRWWWK